MFFAVINVQCLNINNKYLGNRLSKYRNKEEDWRGKFVLNSSVFNLKTIRLLIVNMLFVHSWVVSWYLTNLIPCDKLDYQSKNLSIYPDDKIILVPRIQVSFSIFI